MEKASNQFFVGTLIQEENAALNCFYKNSSNLERKGRLKFLQEQLNTSVESSDQRCYSRVANKINNTEKRSMLMVFTEDFFLNNKKISLILSLFYENCFITDFKENAEFFNSFFSKQYSLIANDSKLSTSLNYVTDQHLSTTTFLAEDIGKIIQSTTTFLAEDIGKIIQSLDPNKGHGYDNVTIRTLKICGDDTICKSLDDI